MFSRDRSSEQSLYQRENSFREFVDRQVKETRLSLVGTSFTSSKLNSSFIENGPTFEESLNSLRVTGSGDIIKQENEKQKSSPHLQKSKSSEVGKNEVENREVEEPPYLGQEDTECDSLAQDVSQLEHQTVNEEAKEDGEVNDDKDVDGEKEDSKQNLEENVEELEEKTELKIEEKAEESHSEVIAEKGEISGEKDKEEDANEEKKEKENEATDEKAEEAKEAIQEVEKEEEKEAIEGGEERVETVEEKEGIKEEEENVKEIEGREQSDKEIEKKEESEKKDSLEASLGKEDDTQEKGEEKGEEKGDEKVEGEKEEEEEEKEAAAAEEEEEDEEEEGEGDEVEEVKVEKEVEKVEREVEKEEEREKVEEIEKEEEKPNLELNEEIEDKAEAITEKEEQKPNVIDEKIMSVHTMRADDDISTLDSVSEIMKGVSVSSSAEHEKLTERIKQINYELSYVNRKNRFLTKEVVEIRGKKADFESGESKLTQGYLKKLVNYEKIKFSIMNEMKRMNDQVEALREFVKVSVAIYEAAQDEFLQKTTDACKKLDSNVGNVAPEKTIVPPTHRLQTALANVGKIRLKMVKLQNHLAEKEVELKSLDDRGGGLHLIDYEKLKMHNQHLIETIAERDLELLRLRKKIETDTQKLAHVRERADFVGEENRKCNDALLDLDTQIKLVREDVNSMKQKRQRITVETRRMRQDAGLLTKPKLVTSFRQTELSLEAAKNQLNDIMQLYQQQQKKINELKKRVHSFSDIRIIKE